ncbi:MAG: polymer-forming cytoskeletal protein [Flavobacteriaceae bacterium]|nr:polymer-forming cytoskeletal protein [Flavobacteriaceae bacterium]
MFNEPKKKQGILPTLSKPNTISESSKITGDFVSEGDIRIDGKLEGTIKTSGKLVIGKAGFVKGKVECANADFEGKFSGDLLVNGLLSLKPSASVSGELIVGKLAVEPGAAIDATCKMKGSLKAISNEQPKVAEKAV